MILAMMPWAGDRLDEGIQEHYLSLVTPDSKVLELGPGSGRLTRHIIGSCAHLTLADASLLVCDWLKEYLDGKGSFAVVHIDGVSMPSIATGSVDVVLAHGVLEHLDQEVISMLLIAIARVLVPGGQFAFNFDNLCSTAAPNILTELAGRTPAHQFRLYHPVAIERLGNMFGFGVQTSSSAERNAFARLTRHS